MPQPNRLEVQDKNPYLHTRKVEVWHSDPQGDLQQHYMYLPQSWRCRSAFVIPGKRMQQNVPCGHCAKCQKVGKAVNQEGRRWIDVLAARGYVMARGGNVNIQSMPAPEWEHLDEDMFIFSARFVRSKPEHMSLDEAEVYAENQPDGTTLQDILVQTSQADVEANAVANRDAEKLLPEVRRTQELLREIRRSHGLPEPKERDDD